MFQDEARFGRISDCRYCWAKFPLRPTVKAMLTHQYVYAYGAVSIPEDNIVMVLDGAGWHKSLSMPIPHNIRLLRLPPYSPELNPVEHIWDELREKYFHNRAFDSLDALEDRLVDGLVALERDPQRNKSICNWDWIIKVTSNANYNKVVDQQQVGKQGLTLDNHHHALPVATLADHAVDFNVTKFDP